MTTETPPAALAPSVALERLIERLREPRTMSQFMGPHDMALALLRERATLADELATMRASLAQQGEAVPLGYMAASSIDALNACRHHASNGYAEVWMRASDVWTVPVFTHPAAVDAAMVERAAIGLWHRFAPDSHIEWADETHKAEYLHAARDLLTAALLPAASEGESNG